VDAIDAVDEVDVVDMLFCCFDVHNMALLDAPDVFDVCVGCA